MVIMSGTATVLQQFVSGLKSRNEDTRAKSAKELQHYVTTELREVTPEMHAHNRSLREDITAVYHSIELFIGSVLLPTWVVDQLIACIASLVNMKLEFGQT